MRGDRRARRALGRSAEGVRGEEGPEPHRAGHPRALQERADRLQASQVRRVPQRAAENERRQDPAPRAARGQEGGLGAGRRAESRLTRANLISGLGWVGLSILCWMPLFSVAKRTLPHIDAFALGTLRYAIGIVLFVLLLVAVEGRQALRYDGKLVPATLFGLIGITGFNLFVWIGLALTRPEHASIILALQTPLTALAVWLRRGQRPASFTLGCVALAICGVFLVITKGDPLGAFADLVSGGALLGDLLVFCGALCWVTYTLSAAQFPQWSPLRLTVLTCIPGAVGLVVANAVALAAGWASLPSAQA